MSDFDVPAQKRGESGSSAMRRLRRTGRIPAVVYGAGKNPEHISVSRNELRKQLENEAFFSHIITVDVGGEKTQVIVRDLQRHPANQKVLHVDFQRIVASEEITMRVPLHFVNEEQSPGRKAGGVFSHFSNEVEISCLPANLPEYIEVDVGALAIGDSVHLSDLVIPEGVSLTVDVSDGDHDHTISAIHMPQELDVGEDAEVDEEDEIAAGTAEEEEGDEDGGHDSEGEDDDK